MTGVRPPYPHVFLFVPASDDRKREKAFTLDVDGILLDLEDAIPDGEKERVRIHLLHWLSEQSQRGIPPGPPLWVRVNGPHTPWFQGDLEVGRFPMVQGIVLPKPDGEASVRQVLGALEAGESRREHPSQVMLLIETARSLVLLPQLAAVAPERTLIAFGTLDFALDIGLPQLRPTDAEAVWAARARVVTETRAAGLAPPIDGVYPDLDDEEGLARECRRLFQLGFTGKLVVHPRQVKVVRQTLRPAPEDIQLARRIVDAYLEGEREGRGAVRLGSLMVDRPVVDQARQLLARWDPEGGSPASQARTMT